MNPNEEIEFFISEDKINSGFFILALDYSHEQLKKLSEIIFNKRKHQHTEVIWLKAEKNESLFQRLRNKPSIYNINGQFFSQSIGLSITQDKPIILVIEDFDKLDTPNDQYNISKLLATEENQTLKTHIHPSSIILVSAKKGSSLDIKQGFAMWLVVK
jgi:hypothetical protein